MSSKEITIVVLLIVVCAAAVVMAIKIKAANAVSGCGSAPSMSTLNFTNKAAKAVKGLYLSSPGGWSENLVTGTPLGSGESRLLKLDHGYLPGANDVKIVYEDGSETIWQRLPMRGIFDITNDERGEPRYDVVALGS